MIAETKKALISHIPTIILIDWNMPDGQGDELCHWIRIGWKDLPLIFLTVRGDSFDVVSGFQNGADDYIVKPFELSVLYHRILAVLRRTKSINESKYIDSYNETVKAKIHNPSCLKQFAALVIV